MLFQPYEGICREHQVLGEKNGLMVIDDYAHNPVKCASSIACQPLAPRDRLVPTAWLWPDPFLKDDFIQEIAAVMRDDDEIWMSEIYYAGGTAVKDISANDLIQGIQALGKKSFFVDRQNVSRMR